jgi:tripartite-type tricarboxylate transporter receptor subunit TctC
MRARCSPAKNHKKGRRKQAMKRFAIIAAALGIGLAMAPAHAVDYPSRPIKLLVGAPPGGTTDTIARSIAVPMAAALKQSVIV